MLMSEGQIYKCQNRNCSCEIRVIKPSVEASSNPRCCCGAEMKKPYAAPMMREVTSEMIVGVKVSGN
jgi:hypothetical protein